MKCPIMLKVAVKFNLNTVKNLGKNLFHEAKHLKPAKAAYIGGGVGSTAGLVYLTSDGKKKRLSNNKVAAMKSAYESIDYYFDHKNNKIKEMFTGSNIKTMTTATDEGLKPVKSTDGGNYFIATRDVTNPKTFAEAKKFLSEGYGKRINSSLPFTKNRKKYKNLLEQIGKVKVSSLKSHMIVGGLSALGGGIGVAALKNKQHKEVHVWEPDSPDYPNYLKTMRQTDLSRYNLITTGYKDGNPKL